MAFDTRHPPPAADRAWYIAGRWEEYEGEGRVNLLRVVGLAAFYAVELANYHGIDLGFFRMPAVVQRPFHLAITFLVLGWAMLALAVYYGRRNGVFPRSLKFVSTGADLILLTTVLALADGPRSPLVVVYFLLIAASGLRFNIELVWFTAGGAMAGYLFLLGFARWAEVPGWERGDTAVPRHAQVIVVLALALGGVIVGQTVRRARHLAEDFARRSGPQGGPTP